MEENSNVAVLITRSSSASSSPTLPLGSQSRIKKAVDLDTSQRLQQKQAADSLIQVIEKLSKIVEKRPQRRCTMMGQKRGGFEERQRGSKGDVVAKKMRRTSKEEARAEGEVSDKAVFPPAFGDRNNNLTPTATEITNNGSSSDHKRTVTCYQCSLCTYLSPTLPLLREHLKQHNELYNDLILMCSECRFSSRDQQQLEEHVKTHMDSGAVQRKDSPPSGPVHNGEGKSVEAGAEKTESSAFVGKEDMSSCTNSPQRKKWYSYEEYGLYRCLICSYVCSQQRNLKTHAWKHAGLVDCSYPIFEDEVGSSSRKDTATAVGGTIKEELVVFSSLPQEKSLQSLPAAFKLQPCVSLPSQLMKDPLNQPASTDSLKVREEEEGPIKDEPVVEVQVTTEAETQVELDIHQDNAEISDSLLSSAQKIINSSPNSAGHINVIVERLPTAEDSVMVTNPLLLSPNVVEGQSLNRTEEEEAAGEVHHLKQEVVFDNIDEDAVGESQRDENIPPAGRKRTHSESLRLHSLAAEALVAMPMRTAELSCSRTIQKTSTPSSNPELRPADVAGQKDFTASAAMLDLEEKHGELGSLGFGNVEDEGPAAKAGISLSLLTVIERLRERSDQNTSDEDILKELQDNAQFHHGASAGAGVDGSPDGSLVEYIPGSDRPYRCRLCRYSSGNKGYIKQHLRVHRQRLPYQCPICEHIAADSKDLENHMIHHCKTRMYQCKQCQDAFHYKSQLRAHEREHHDSTDTSALTPLAESATPGEELERANDEDGGLQKMFKCDVCDYTSSTYVGVRNHRRFHNSDKPYRCCSCDFATTNMNSLKSHMRRHPQEHQAVQLLEQYRCSLCGYVCSHPPSLKSHMWKHAGDQNYNYEQVNKAINEAISQSSRAPQKLSEVQESLTERPAVAPASAGQQKTHESAPVVARLGADAQVKTEPSQSVSAAHLGSNMEYCVLLFCCCICGFESTSKERLMEHMKEHEGDIISIILNKDQLQTAQQADVPAAE
ncbi:zinc finger protein 507 [Synchiropus splendidus]|uniref:zinc finger protein 507 n=1 Tax=Synchiropus splendidus TaxID=270530 RepID=UPI00237E414C|nr:zinc finger protein 507 [Synchiropus splendidus]